MKSQRVEALPRPAVEAERSEAGGGGRASVARRPDPEVGARAKRRQFTAKYKARIVRQADACVDPGEIGAFLRHEGLYSSQLSKWRQAMREGALVGLNKKRGRKKDPDTELQRRNRELEQDNIRLKRKLQQAETVIEVQKKLSEMLEIPLDSDDNSS